MDLGQLAELVELVDEVVATSSWQSLGNGPSLALPAHPETAQPASSTPIFAQIPHGGSVAVQAASQTVLAAEPHVSTMSRQSSGLTEEEGSFHSRSSCIINSSTSMTAAHLSSLQEVFTVHVMCDFTPRVPKELSTSKWTTLEQLFIRLQQHAPTETTMLDRINIRQLITEWFKDHPAFAGLPYSAWCKRLKDNSPQAHARSLTYKFCFEYTPRGVGLRGLRKAKRRHACTTNSLDQDGSFEGRDETILLA